MKKKIGILMIILIIIISWGLYQYSHTSSPREIEGVYMTGGTTPQFYDNLMFFWDFKRYEDNNELILEVVDIVKENSQSIVLSSIHWEDDGHWPTPYITVREDNSYAIGVVDRVIYYNPQTGDIQNKQLPLGC